MQNDAFELPIVENTKILHQGFLTLVADRLKLPNREAYEYCSLITKGSAVIILGTTTDNLYVLNEEYRHPTKEVVLCCPGGYMDANESPLEAAKREFLEETGYEAKRFELIGSSYPYPGISNQKLYYVRAYEAKKTAAPKLDHSEIIKTTLKTLEELKKAIHTQPLDGTLCTAFFFETISKI